MDRSDRRLRGSPARYGERGEAPLRAVTDSATSDQIEAILLAQNRQKLTIANHTRKINELIDHLIAVELILDGIRKEIKKNGGKEVLTFRKEEIEKEKEDLDLG